MKNFLFYLITVLIILLLLAGEVAALYYFGNDTWYNRFGFVLEIIGFYGVGLGFVQISELLKSFRGIDEMTSPNPLRFLRGNFVFLSIISSIYYVALSSNRSTKGLMSLGLLGQFLVLASFPFLLIYFLIHLLVICPFAYVGYLFASAFVEGITGSADDVGLVSSAPGKEIQTLSIRKMITSNQQAAKSFLIGIPSILLGFITKTVGMFFG